jgi:polysaccharide pyruvyl transferase WcaK-like protein
MTRLNIVLYGHFGSGNIGNDSSLEAMIYNIHKYCPASDITCICTGPDIVAQRFGIKTVPTDVSELRYHAQSNSRFIFLIKRFVCRGLDELKFWLRQPRWFKRVDQFIVVGTGAVDDMAIRWPWNAPYDLFKWCSAAKMGGAKVIFLSVGVGPIMNRLSRILMLKALRMADYRSYRELAAFDYLHSVNFRTKGDVIFPDLVFSLPPVYTAGVKRISGDPKRIGLGVISYYGWRHDPRIGESVYQEYLAKVKQFIGWLFRHGYSVRIIYGDTADQRPVDELIDEMRATTDCERNIKWFVDKINNVDELFREISQIDILVASRFHNVLCGLMLERPVISLGYHRKNVDLLSDIGLEKYCQYIEEFSVEILIEQLKSCIVNYAHIQELIHAKVASYETLLDQQYRELLGREEV